MARKGALMRLRSFWNSRTKNAAILSAEDTIQTVETKSDVFAVASLRKYHKWSGRVRFGNGVDDEVCALVKHYGFRIEGPSAQEVLARFAQPGEKDEDEAAAAAAEIAKPKTQAQLDREKKRKEKKLERERKRKMRKKNLTDLADSALMRLRSFWTSPNRKVHTEVADEAAKNNIQIVETASDVMAVIDLRNYHRWKGRVHFGKHVNKEAVVSVMRSDLEVEGSSPEEVLARFAQSEDEDEENSVAADFISISQDVPKEETEDDYHRRRNRERKQASKKRRKLTEKFMKNSADIVPAPTADAVPAPTADVVPKPRGRRFLSLRVRRTFHLLLFLSKKIKMKRQNRKK